MALKKYKPVTAGMRQLVLVDKSHLWSGAPVKALTKGKTRSSGRNNLGRITSRHRGGAHKRSYRMIDFRRARLDAGAVVERLEYDPNRTAFIALVKYEDGELAYILAPQKISIGDVVTSSNKMLDIRIGNSMPLGLMPAGTIVHAIEMNIGGGAKLARSAGTYAQILGRAHGYVILRLSSGEQRRVHGNCRATIGAVSNPDHMNISISKAGRNRWLGIRPQTRGVAMNPVDHPHGGGEGKTSGGRHPVTPKGFSTKGARTRKPKQSDRFIVRSRHMKKSRRG